MKPILIAELKEPLVVGHGGAPSSDIITLLFGWVVMETEGRQEMSEDQQQNHE